ncbi:uncharacterized protein LOC142462929 isoform X1 [Ascaphus truei]|uniref:uncharacterized protein LOC142462929 isoform X1 n=2 Tax=Ascaphus truei TaxID=8439 RepID=UPI003F5966AA
MNKIFLITWLIGVHFALPVSSFTVRHGRHGQKQEEKFNSESMWQQKINKGGNREKNISEEHRAIDTDHELQSIDTENHKINIGDLQMEGDRSNFHIQRTLNLNMGESDNKGTHTLDTEERHQKRNEHTHTADQDQNVQGTTPNQVQEKNEENGEYNVTTGQTRESSVSIQENPQFVSDEQQNEESLSSNETSEEYDHSLMKTLIQSEELDDNNKKDDINMPGEPYEDKVLQYSFNITQQEKDNELKSKNDSDRVLIDMELEEQSHQDAIFFSSSEINNGDNKDDGDYSDNGQKSENTYFGHEKRDTEVNTHASDVNMSQEESVQAEERIRELDEKDITSTDDDKIGGDAEKGADTNETGDTVRNEGSREKIQLNLEDLSYGPHSPTTNKLEKYTSLQQNSESQTGHKDDAANTTLDNANESLDKSNVKKLFPDPCRSFHCKRGKTCEIDEQGNPMCVCQDPAICPAAAVNDHICGTDNTTYDSPCHLLGTKCKLERAKEGSHLHLDYQGPCKHIPPCSDYELAHFPFRMRDWLKNVLMQLYERDLETSGILSEKQTNKVKKLYQNEKHFLEGDHHIDLLLIRDFEKNYDMYVYPVHWQFNELDQHSVDRLLTRSELAHLRAPLIPMEHCVTAFFQGCNANKDKHISLKEWCHCFGIREEDIDEDLLF